MEVTERDIEVAERQEREAKLRAEARIRAELQEQGVDDCIDCGSAIPADRKAALPSAVRCIECQRASERNRGG